MSAASAKNEMRSKSSNRMPPKSEKGDPSSSTMVQDVAMKVLSPKKPFAPRSLSSKNAMVLKKGPSDPAGTVIRLSDRSSLCMSTRGAEVAIGSSDHAVYIINVEKEKFVRALYGKQWGHSEWVTCIQFLNDGRILSGGMDGKLCLWEKNVVRCKDLVGHKASISGCKAILDCSLAISSSYDKTLKIWDLMNGPRMKPPSCVATLEGHAGAVTTFTLSCDLKNIVSGSRFGEVVLWDGEQGRRLMHCKDAHVGQVTVVHNIVRGDQPGREECTRSTRDLFVSGGQDGHIRVWDFKTQATPVQNTRAFQHSPVSYLATSQDGDHSSLIVVAGNKTLKVLDPRASFQAIHTMNDHVESIFCLCVYEGGLVWSGAADGKLLVHEIATGECLYGLGAVAKGAVRCACLAQGDKLVVAGDDGNVLIYSH